MGPWVVYVVVNIHIGTFGGFHMATVVPSHSGHKVMQVGYRAAHVLEFGLNRPTKSAGFFSSKIDRCPKYNGTVVFRKSSQAVPDDRHA